MDANFPYALNRVLGVEGGISNDPNDHGGFTNHGIIQTEYDTYRLKRGLPSQSVALISNSEIVDIYRTEYWLPAQCDKLPAGVDVIHFDVAVNSGPREAAILLQRSIGATVDGIIGQHTLDKVNSLDARSVVGEYVQKRSDYYVDIVEKDVFQMEFLKGWLRRAISFIK